MVLTYLQELGPNAGLTQKELTLKLAMLLALVSRARGHELHAINPEAISWHEDKVVCHILGMTKTKTMSRPQKAFELLRFKESNNIDQVQCLKSYLNMTANQRETKVQKSHLFLSFVPPHHVVKTCSIARWLRLIMQEAGIDMSKFKAHSTRSAAVSKVPLAGMSVNEIAKLGDWSNASTFYRFYKKDVQSNHLRVWSRSLFWVYHSGELLSDKHAFVKSVNFSEIKFPKLKNVMYLICNFMR